MVCSAALANFGVKQPLDVGGGQQHAKALKSGQSEWPNKKAADRKSTACHVF